jgi:parallel beta-helix repeat protein
MEVTMLRRDVSVGLIAATAASAFVKETQARTGAPVRFPQTAAELAAGVTPIDHSHLPGNVLRYGSNARPGSTDMTGAIQSAIRQAARAGGAPAYVPRGTYRVPSQTLTLLSTVTLYGDGSSSIIQFGSTARQDCIQGVGVTGVRIARLAFALLNEQSGSDYVGTVAFRLNSTHCVVEECEFTGVTQSGILLSGSSSCIVSRNSFSDFAYGSGRNDSSDIHLMTDAVSATLTAGTASIGGANTFVDGTPVHFPSGSDLTGVTGFAAGRTYYVSAKGLSTGAFQLAATRGGPAITPGGRGKAALILLTPYDCAHNIIDSNWCFGGNNIGISMETSAKPNNRVCKNVISNNRVGRHTAYGILAYCHQSGDTYNEIIGNYVENISGESSAQGRAAGAGIYVVGMGAVTIANNTITNCCSMTQSASLAPGGIGINSPADCSAITIVGNSIYDMAQGNSSRAPVAGIYVAAAPAGTTLCGNSIAQRQRGGLVAGIFVSSGNGNLTITGNNINIAPESAPQTRGILLQTAGSSSRNITIAGNTVLGCSTRGVSFEAGTSGYGIEVFTISGNVISGGGPGTIPLYLEGARYGAVTGNSCSAGDSAVALFLRGSQFMRYSGNMLYSGGGATVSGTGNCMGSVFDESNFVDGAVNSDASGLRVKSC